MAKDVDLSSKQWLDIVFDGKNQDYGAYSLRSASEGRHNKAMLYTIIGIAAVALLGILFISLPQLLPAEEEVTDTIEQTDVDLSSMDDQDEEVEEEQVKYEEPEPEVIPEEVLNTTKATELKITADAEVKEEIKSQDEMQETQTAVGATDFDKGTDDLAVVTEHKAEVVVEEKVEEKPVENKVYDVVEQMPVYPGGEAALMKYIAEHIRYPEAAAANNVQGRVVVKFVVTKTGKVGQVQVVRSKDPDLDKEAVRVVKTLPNFTPGKMNGHAVDVWYTLPINFKLQGV